MGKHNYNAQYNKFQGARSEAPVMDETAEVAEETVEEAVEEVKADTSKTNTEMITGIVDNCDKLNVRRNPTLSAKPLTVINKGSEVQIDTNNSTSEWYKVCTTNGIEGYCMKEFITIK